MVTSELTFDKDWGLGSSSTLISNLSQLARIDPYELNNRVFNGSGYDIACAKSESPLLYRLIKNERDISGKKEKEKERETKRVRERGMAFKIKRGI